MAPGTSIDGSFDTDGLVLAPPMSAMALPSGDAAQSFCLTGSEDKSLMLDRPALVCLDQAGENSGALPSSKPVQAERTQAAAKKSTKRMPRPRCHHHHVYVIELADPVWNEASFRKANPDHQLGKPFVYVGMTGLDPDLRFDKHKAGIQANRFVFKYGLRLLPALYEVYNPMPYEAAREMEVELAIGLREAGYGVWQA